MQAKFLTASKGLVPYVQAFTYAVLCPSLIQRWRNTWRQRIADLVVWLACLALHRSIQPLSSLSVAIGYTVWTYLPGSFVSLNLPNHSDFMRTVPFDRTSDDQCMICWDNEHGLAKLPCGHRGCKNCLHLMGEHIQTTCPLRRTPLFGMHDFAIFAISKASVALSAINGALFLVSIIDDIRRTNYTMALPTIGILCGTGWYMRLVAQGIRNFGVNWWRGNFKKQTIELRVLGFAFVSGAVTVPYTIWNMSKQLL